MVACGSAETFRTLPLVVPDAGLSIPFSQSSGSNFFPQPVSKNFPPLFVFDLM